MFLKKNLLPFSLLTQSKVPKPLGLFTVMTSHSANSTTCKFIFISTCTCLVHTHTDTDSLISQMHTGLILALLHTDMVLLLQWEGEMYMASCHLTTVSSGLAWLQVPFFYGH